MRDFTVKEMLEYASANELKLLSTYQPSSETSDFWKVYRDNNVVFDMLFTRLYKNYRFYDQEDEDIDIVTLHFIETVYSWLLINQKKYEELMRINNITMEDNLLEDVDYTRQDNGTTRLGERNDTTTSVSGQRQDTLQEQVYPFETDSASDSSKNTTNKGEETDTDTFAKGAETDTTNNTTTVHGKMGGLTKDQVIKKHLDTWDGYKYYLAIFNDIARAFLLV